jgi:hypothetical protein
MSILKKSVIQLLGLAPMALIVRISAAAAANPLNDRADEQRERGSPASRQRYRCPRARRTARRWRGPPAMPSSRRDTYCSPYTPELPPHSAARRSRGPLAMASSSYGQNRATGTCSRP